MTAIVVDTGAIVAFFDEDDPHQPTITRILADEQVRPVISPLIVAETDYLLAKRFGASAARRFAEDLATEAYEIVDWTSADQADGLLVLDAYPGEGHIGMADASNVVIADRYRTNQMLTLDQRHFRLLQPLWGFDHFVLLPFDA